MLTPESEEIKYLVKNRLKLRTLMRIASVEFDIEDYVTLKAIFADDKLFEEFKTDYPSWIYATHLMTEMKSRFAQMRDVLTWQKSNGRHDLYRYQTFRAFMEIFLEHRLCLNANQCPCNYLDAFRCYLFILLNQYKTGAELKIELEREIKSASIYIARLWRDLFNSPALHFKKGVLKEEGELTAHILTLMRGKEGEVKAQILTLTRGKEAQALTESKAISIINVHCTEIHAKYALNMLCKSCSPSV